ncbi:MAG: hypothetical protein KDD12_23215 [Lewinella sp.]|nr:hypothetical protein [Lewinella sp.]
MSRKTTYRLLGLSLMISFYLGLLSMFSMSYLGLESAARMVMVFDNLVEEENECDFHVGDDADAKILQHFSFSALQLQKAKILVPFQCIPPDIPHMEVQSPPPEPTVFS